MSKLKHLRLLAQHYPTIESATGELIHQRTLLELPKGTEFFFSDLHGEDKAFIYLLRSASGIIKNKIKILFERQILEEEQNQLANLISNPDQVLKLIQESGRFTDEWIKITIHRLVQLLRFVSSKYPRTRVREKTSKDYADIIEQLLYISSEKEDNPTYFNAIFNSIISNDFSRSFIINLCEMIQNVSVDTLHIIGDIYDRGPGPHKIMDELMTFPDVDIQWGNHDIIWMAAAAGSEVAMANVLRIAIRYNSFDCLEDGYGINLRPLALFAASAYAKDDCKVFEPKILDENEFNQVNPKIAAKMHKAITIIQFKLEGQVYQNNPQFEMDDRNVLCKINFDNMEINIAGKNYPLTDSNFPTIDPKDPLKLSAEEAELMHSLHASFTHSVALKNHINYFFTHGAAYTCANNNLLFHGCIPIDEDGDFEILIIDNKDYSGKSLMDYVHRQVRKSWYEEKGSKAQLKALDFMWYLWCGPKSPMFGKDKMATFESYFVADKTVAKEKYSPYYSYSLNENTCNMILEEFGLDPNTSHIINGHVPVKIKDGETPIKANGKLFVIDGGIAKAYQPKTGIAGYTLIYNSHHLALVEHHSFDDIEHDSASYTPKLQIVEEMSPRRKIKDTDEGEKIKYQIADLKDLIKAYKRGDIKTK